MQFMISQNWLHWYLMQKCFFLGIGIGSIDIANVHFGISYWCNQCKRIKIGFDYLWHQCWYKMIATLALAPSTTNAYKSELVSYVTNADCLYQGACAFWHQLLMQPMQKNQNWLWLPMAPLFVIYFIAKNSGSLHLSFWIFWSFVMIVSMRNQDHFTIKLIFFFQLIYS